MNNNKQYNLIQRVVFVIGIVVLIGLISLLLFEMTPKTKKPPILEISTTHQVKHPDNAYQIWIRNFGEETAENTTVLLNLYKEGEIAESGTISINYIPPGSKAEAWIVFHADSKSDDSLVVSSVTYIVP